MLLGAIFSFLLMLALAPAKLKQTDRKQSVLFLYGFTVKLTSECVSSLIESQLWPQSMKVSDKL